MNICPDCSQQTLSVNDEGDIVCSNCEYWYPDAPSKELRAFYKREQTTKQGFGREE